MIPPHLLPAPMGVPPRQRPAEVLGNLAAQLRRHGLTHMYSCACRELGVLSLPGVSVWTNGRVLWWRTATNETTWPAADAPGAARRLAGLSRGQADAGPAG